MDKDGHLVGTYKSPIQWNIVNTRKQQGYNNYSTSGTNRLQSTKNIKTRERIIIDKTQQALFLVSKTSSGKL